MKLTLPNDKMGFYTVNGKKFYGKIDAILEANKTLADVEWHFNDEVFGTIDWKTEPETSLLELYRLRAKQIREEYDYVILMCSGGADSTNVLYSFLKNGIHVDEVVMGAPLSGLKKYNFNDKDLSATNTISETKYAQLPLADEIRLNWPNVKVTVNDYFTEMLDYKSEDWMRKASHYLHPTCCRYSLEQLHHVKDMAENGKKIAKVFGLDKPTLIRGPNGMLFNTLTDTVCQVGNHMSTIEEYPNLETVYFYFTPDMPEIMVKQSHVLAKWMYQPENRLALQTAATVAGGAKWNLNEDRFSIHHRANIEIIYPMLQGRKVFQANKSFQHFTHITFDDWFFKLHGDSKLSQMIDSDFNLLTKGVDRKYFNDLGTSFQSYHKNFLLGYEKDFM